jgi:hypothetical protein
MSTPTIGELLDASIGHAPGAELAYGPFRGAAALPNLLMIGAPKTGTSSLHQYLSQHPEVAMSLPKELRYFWREDWRERREWYESHFDPSKPVRGESTPAYTAWPHRDRVPERAAEMVPDAKLIYCVRDPIDRIVSHYVQERANGVRESFESFMDRVDDPSNIVVCSSRYGTQLERWLEHYDMSQIMVVDQHELGTQREATVRQVFRWLGVDPDVPLDLETELNTNAHKIAMRPWARAIWANVLWPASRSVPESLKKRVRGRAQQVIWRRVTEKPDVTPAIRARLVGHLAPEMARFRELTGRAFDTWSV